MNEESAVRPGNGAYGWRTAVISPAFLAAASASIALAAFVAPNRWFLQILGEPGHVEGNGTALLYVLVCCFLFVLGASTRPPSRVGRPRERSPVQVSRSQLVLVTLAGTVLAAVNVRFLLSAVNQLGKVFVIAAVTGVTRSVELRSGISEILDSANVGYILVANRPLFAWLLWVALRTTRKQSLIRFVPVTIVGLTNLSLALLMQSRGYVLSIMFVAAIILFVDAADRGRVSLTAAIAGAGGVLAVALGIFAYVQLARLTATELRSPAVIVFEGLFGYLIGPYNRFGALVDGTMTWSGAGSGYYWMQWLWEFPGVSGLLDMPRVVAGWFGPPPPSGFLGRTALIMAGGLNARFTSLSVFGHAYVDGGWWATLPFWLYGALVGVAWRKFGERTQFGIMVYPSLAWTVVEWRGYIEITRPAIPVLFAFVLLYMAADRLFADQWTALHRRDGPGVDDRRVAGG